MAGELKGFSDKFSFFTQSVVVGRDKKGHPKWRRFIEYDKRGWPHWADWEGMRDSIIQPLCDVTNSLSIWYEWRSECREVLKLKTFVEEHVQKHGRYWVVTRPMESVNEPLFWSGGGRDFTVVQVLTFSLDRLEFVLRCLTWHRQAGKKSSRYGAIFDSVNRFAKTAVKNGGFAVIITGAEAEIFVPLEYKELTEKVAREVDARHSADMGWA